MDFFSCCDGFRRGNKLFWCKKSSNTVKATPLPLGKLFAIYSVVFVNMFGV